MDSVDQKPVVASYCATFLKPEMLHIYRQLTALDRVSPIVIAQKRENEARFPFPNVHVVEKPGSHFLRRIWFKQIREQPWQVSRGETETVRKILDQSGAQLLHIYFGHIAVHLLPLMRTWSRPTVVSFHGADVMVDLEKPAYAVATRAMLTVAKLILVRSESLGHALVSLGAEPEKIRIQRTGIPVGEIPFQPRTWPADGAWKFLQACRLIEKKGLRTSLAAFADFAARFPKATFTIAGEGPLLSELKNEVNEMELRNKVKFTGFVAQKELRELFYQSHIFLHPSEIGADGNQEGVPNSMLEAMASGLPVFATEHGGIPEAIEHRKSGILVAEKDAPSLARELFAAVADQEKLSELATEGAAAVREKFEQHAQIRKLEDCYFEAMAS